MLFYQACKHTQEYYSVAGVWVAIVLNKVCNLRWEDCYLSLLHKNTREVRACNMPKVIPGILE